MSEILYLTKKIFILQMFITSDRYEMDLPLSCINTGRFAGYNNDK